MPFVITLLFMILGQLCLAQSQWNMHELSRHLGYQSYADVKTLTPDEKWAIASYSFTDEFDYQDINGYLRLGSDYSLYNKTETEVIKLIEDIKSAAKKLPMIPSDLTVFRGIKLNWRRGKCFDVGEVFSDRAFISTTLNQKIAEHFAFKINSNHGAFLTLKLASSQPGILINEYGEDEVLLMPNKIFIITKSYLDNNRCYAEALVY